MTNPNQNSKKFSLSLVLLVLLLTQYFSQIWIEVGGFTFRTQDLFLAFLLMGLILRLFNNGKLRYRPKILNRPLLMDTEKNWRGDQWYMAQKGTNKLLNPEHIENLE